MPRQFESISFQFYLAPKNATRHQKPYNPRCLEVLESFKSLKNVTILYLILSNKIKYKIVVIQV